MNIQRKLQKVFSAEGFQSAIEHGRRWLQPVDSAKMFRSLPAKEWAEIYERYLGPNRDKSVGDSAKFANAKYWLKVNIERAQDLRLDRAQPLRILDLGCGAGYFLYVCSQWGHEAIGLDLDENQLYRDTIAQLGARRVICRIDPFVPLPDLGAKFDLVASHCVCFQKLERLADGNWTHWGVPEWTFFLNDVRTSILKPGGRLLLDFNPQPDGSHYPAAVRDFFLAQGARIFRSKVLFSA